MKSRKSNPYLGLLAVAALLFSLMTGAIPVVRADPEPAIDISAKVLGGHSCDASEWHFLITGITDGVTPPASITVNWANSASASVALGEVTGQVAHYTTTANLGSTVTSATASISGEWGGEFNLSHGPCTQANEQTIIVDKVTVPGGDPQSFTFTTAGTGYAGFSLTDAAAPNSQSLEPGTYSVSETVPAGWALSSATCSDGSPVTAIVLGSGETVTCTFTNTRQDRGAIVVDKVTSPAGDSQSFTFTTTGAGYTGFSLTDAAAPNSQSLAPGTYSVAETMPASWDQTGATCSGGNTPAAIVLTAGVTVTCVFVNTKDGGSPPPGILIVDKVTVPGGDPQSFTFTTTGTGYAGFSLTDAAAPNSQSLDPGTYSVSETVPVGWALSSATCSDGSPVTAIVLGSGETVTCTFTNTRQDRGSIVVDKVTSPAGDSQSFTFTTTGSGYAGFSLTDGATPNSQSLAPGTYSVAETVPAGWDQTGATCSGGNTPAAIVLTAGATVTCVFVNTKDGALPPPGSIVVDKVTSPSGDPQSFTFTTTGPGYAGFSLTDAAAPNSQSLEPGTYSVAETAPAGWDPTGATCDNGNPVSAIVLVAGATVTCTFTNRKWGAIVVDKVTSPSGDSQSFTFTTTGSGYAGFSLTDGATPNSQSLAPGTYSVAENAVQGWTPTNAACSGGNTPAAIVLTAGATVTCVFVNTAEGGSPPPGILIVDKVTVPGGAVQSFAFTTTGSGYAGFSLSDGAAPNSQSLEPGTYSVAETVPAGWALSSATCSDGSPVTAIVLSSGEIVACTFTNTRLPAPTGGGAGGSIDTPTPAATASPAAAGTTPVATVTPTAVSPAGGGIGGPPALAPAAEVAPESPPAQVTPVMSVNTVAAPVALPNTGGPLFPVAVPAAAGLALAGIGLVLRRRGRSARTNKSS